MTTLTRDTGALSRLIIANRNLNKQSISGLPAGS